MSHTRVKTTYLVSGPFGSSETVELYCDHNNSCDTSTFYYADGSIADMFFEDWVSGKNKFDAVLRLMSPFKEGSHTEYKEGVEWYGRGPWEQAEE